MSIIKAVQDWLSEYEGMSMRPLSEIRTDLTEEQPSSYALAAAGNSKIEEDILGNCTYQNSYVFYARELASNEIDRADTHEFLDRLKEWIEEKNASGDLPSLPDGYTAEGIEVSNAMLFGIDENGVALYQVQIQLTYVKGVR